MDELELLKRPKGDFGRWLAAELRTRHLSMREAGHEIGVSHSQVRNWVAGQRPTDKSIRKVARWAAVPPEQIMAMLGYPLSADAEEAPTARLLSVAPEKLSVGARLMEKPLAVLELALATIDAAETKDQDQGPAGAPEE